MHNQRKSEFLHSSIADDTQYSGIRSWLGSLDGIGEFGRSLDTKNALRNSKKKGEVSLVIRNEANKNSKILPASFSLLQESPQKEIKENKQKWKSLDFEKKLKNEKKKDEFEFPISPKKEKNNLKINRNSEVEFYTTNHIFIYKKASSKNMDSRHHKTNSLKLRKFVYSPEFEEEFKSGREKSKDNDINEESQEIRRNGAKLGFRQKTTGALQKESSKFRLSPENVHSTKKEKTKQLTTTCSNSQIEEESVIETSKMRISEQIRRKKENKSQQEEYLIEPWQLEDCY